MLMKRTNQILKVLLIVVILPSCSSTKENKIMEQEIYGFINNVMPELTMEYADCDAISNKTLMTVDGTCPPPPGMELNPKEEFLQFAKNDWIKLDDIEFLMKQQNDSTFEFHREKILKRLIKQQTLDSVFNLPNDVGYEILENKYNIQTHGLISKPFFTSDKKTVIIVFEKYWDYLFGQGYILIYKKIDNQWTEYKKLGTWES